MKDRLPATGMEGRMLITPENGDPPFYAIVTMADSPSEDGTPLIKATLLQDQTAARYGKGDNAVPDDIFDQIATELDLYTLAQASGVKLAVGSYVGDGRYSNVDRTNDEIIVDDPTVIEFGFTPRLVYLTSSSIIGWSGTPLLVYPASEYSGGDNNDALLEWGDTSLTIRSIPALPEAQFNAEGVTYHWLVIGFGNTGLDFDRLDYLEQLQKEQEVTV